MSEAPEGWSDAPLGSFSPEGFATDRVAGVSVSGTDCISFLQGQLSQDVSAMAVGTSARSLLLEPDGTLGFLVWLARRSEAEVVIVGAGKSRAEIIGRLRRFKLRVAVSIEPVEITMLWVGPQCTTTPPDDAIALLDNRIPGQRFVTTDLALQGSVPPQALAVLPLRVGSIEPDDASFCRTPHELGQSLVSEATSFSKGCYTGQELVARVDARGASAPFRLVHCAGEGSLQTGSPVHAGDDEVGALCRMTPDPTSRRSLGFARIARKALLVETASLTVEGVTLSIEIS